MNVAVSLIPPKYFVPAIHFPMVSVTLNTAMISQKFHAKRFVNFSKN